MTVEVDTPGTSVPNSAYGLCARTATLYRSRVTVEVDTPGTSVPNSAYGLCARTATLYRNRVTVEVDVLDCPSLMVPTGYGRETRVKKNHWP